MKAINIQKQLGSVWARINLLVLFNSLTMSASAQTDLPTLADRDRAMTMPGEFVLASVGDLMIRRLASQLADPEVQAVLDLIRNADLAVANIENRTGNRGQTTFYRYRKMRSAH